MKHAGYEVAVYASTQELLDRLPSDGNPSCILLDVRLPGLSGPELQERLMEIRQKIGMVFQEGALFDSLSVYDNVAYRLREQKARESEIVLARRVSGAACPL